MIQDILNNLTLFDLVLLAAFNVLFMLRMIFIFFFTGKVLFVKKEKGGDGTLYPLSLFITVRNEEKNLKEFLPELLSLEEVDFEVIAVDDFSQDSSYLVLGALKKKYKQLKISLLNQETRYSMKLAQNLAIKAARNDWVMTIPVSVTNFSETWLKVLSVSLSDKKDVVIGYSGFTITNSWYNKLLRIENFFQQLKSTSFILSKLPFIYAEENVAFRKKKYFDKGGYGRYINNPYANLEFIINSFISKASATILFDEYSAIRKTVPETKENFFELLKKRIRIEETLSNKIRTVLEFDELTKLLFLPFAIVSFLFMIELWPFFLLIHGFKILVYLLLIKTIQIRLNERKIYVSSLVYDLIMPYFRIIYRWHFNRRSKKKWIGKM